MSKAIALINGKVLDPKTKRIERQNILIQGGKVSGIGYVPDEDEDKLDIIQLKSDHLIVPGILDLGPNFREPGREDRETISSGASAALKGGITGVALSPKTVHPIDTPEKVDFVCNKAKGCGVNVYPIGAITQGCEGDALAEMALMKESGAVAFSDHYSVEKTQVLKNAMTYASLIGMPIIIGPAHGISDSGGVMNQGKMATILGMKGVSATAEVSMIESVLTLQSVTGAQIHFSHVSTEKGLGLIIQAKTTGAAVTCGVSPMYFRFTEENLSDYDPMLKVDPPLRTESDRAAILKGILNGEVDVISSHHEPCTIDDKRTDFTDAAFGCSGIELLVPLLITFLHVEHGMDMASLMQMITVNPHRILGIPFQGIKLGKAPNLSVFNLKKIAKVEKETLQSKGHNSPFIGESLAGVCEWIVVNGKMTNPQAI
ncbi:dihydroorotase [bacterium]|jgi:dihydroorotase|nr:dihydroorotase [bacterium]